MIGFRTQWWQINFFAQYIYIYIWKINKNEIRKDSKLSGDKWISLLYKKCKKKEKENQSEIFG